MGKRRGRSGWEEWFAGWKRRNRSSRLLAGFPRLHVFIGRSCPWTRRTARLVSLPSFEDLVPRWHHEAEASDAGRRKLDERLRALEKRFEKMQRQIERDSKRRPR
jgi:hypothetical protein